MTESENKGQSLEDFLSEEASELASGEGTEEERSQDAADLERLETLERHQNLTQAQDIARLEELRGNNEEVEEEEEEEE